MERKQTLPDRRKPRPQSEPGITNARPSKTALDLAGSLPEVDLPPHVPPPSNPYRPSRARHAASRKHQINHVPEPSLQGPDRNLFNFRLSEVFLKRWGILKSAARGKVVKNPAELEIGYVR